MGMSGMILGLPLGSCCWSSGSSASISVSQAPVCISLVPADLHECGPFTVHGFPLCPCSWSRPPFLPFCLCPSLARKTLMGCSLPWPVPPTQLRSSPPPPCHLLARVQHDIPANSYYNFSLISYIFFETLSPCSQILISTYTRTTFFFRSDENIFLRKGFSSVQSLSRVQLFATP